MKEIKVPVLPESITEATVAAWHKKPGDYVELDDVIVEIETDKVVLEVPAGLKQLREAQRKNFNIAAPLKTSVVPSYDKKTKSFRLTFRFFLNSGL